MEKSLVSIVTPCYNTGKYIHRLLDSVLKQTYPNIEMFVINDGSTDDSVEIVSSYIKRFQERGYSLSIITQPNSGQSVAIKEGMKLISGKYFVWPDSDDFYASYDVIERMVNTFEKLGNEYGLVRTQENLLEDETLKIIGRCGTYANADTDKKQLFEDCLFAKKSFFFCAGAYMADFSKLKECTTLNIYAEKNAGQNWQLMLPLLYNYKCYTIQAPLYNVIVRLASHSRGQYKGYDKTMTKITSYEQTILETIDRIEYMPQCEREQYSLDVRKKYCKERIQQSFEYHMKADFNKYYGEALGMDCIGNAERFRKIFFHLPIVLKGFFYIKRHLMR